MAAMASIVTKVPEGLKHGVVQRNRLGNINRLPHSNLQVKCIAQEPKEASGIGSVPPLFTISPAPEGVSPSNSLQVRTKVETVIELATGRAAMLGFLGVVAVELLTGADFWSQLYGGGAQWIALIETITLVGTLVPSIQGICLSGSFFTTTAELWNGRTAMVGIVGLALNEYIRGGPLL